MDEASQHKEPGDFALKFELLRDHYRRPDGEIWKGTELERSTRGVVSSSYVTAITKGSINYPGFKYLEAIAGAMGFPFDYWRLDVEDLRQLLEEAPNGSRAIEAEAGSSARSMTAAGAIDLVHTMVVSDEVVIIYRSGGFSKAQRLLLQKIADQLK